MYISEGAQPKKAVCFVLCAVCVKLSRLKLFVCEAFSY